MRRVLAVLVSLLVVSAPAGAQSLGVPQGPSITLKENVLPPVECPGAVSYLHQICSDLQAAVLQYNAEVNAINQIRAIQAREAEYLRYPQRLQSYVHNDLAQLQQIASQTQQALNWDAQVQKRMNDLFASGQAQVNTRLDAVLGRIQQESLTYRDELLRGLGDTSKISAANQRDGKRADLLMSDAAKATNATEAVQALAQLAGLLYSATTRAQAIQTDQLRLDISQAAATRAKADGRTNYAARAAKINAQVFDPSLPSPPPSTSGGP